MLLFSGIDPDDCLAVARMMHAAEQSIPRSFINRVRQSPRPLVGAAMAAADPPLRYPIAEFSLALSHATVQQIQPPEARPLGTAMSHDFPPRFCHLLVADAGVKARRWPDAKAFREAPVLQSI